MKASAGRVLMLVESSFPEDTRVKNEACTLTEHGYRVSVVALRRKRQAMRECVGGVSVYRIPRLVLFGKASSQKVSFARRALLKVKAFIGYSCEYVYFTTACFVISVYIGLRHGIDVIHAHNPPDTLFLVGAFHKLFGRRFVFDHHDLCPELYRSRYRTEGTVVCRMLETFERLSLKLADVAIATNESYREIEIRRGGISADRVFVVRNGPDLNRVRQVPPDPGVAPGKTVLGYVGAMNPQDGIDYLLRALRHLAYDLGRRDFFCVLIGDGDSLEDLKAEARTLGVQDYVRFTGFVSDADVIRYLSTAEICLDPDPTSPLNNVSTWIKVMEYMALGKPIVTFDLKETRVSAVDAAVYVTPNVEMEFAKAIAMLMDDPDRRRRMGEFGRARVQRELNWGVTSRNLVRAYESLFGEGRVRAGARQTSA